MKKAIWLAAVVCVWGCGGNQPGTNTLNNSGAFNKPGTAGGPLAAATALLKGNAAKVIGVGNDLGFKLFTGAAKDAEENVLVSPVGLASLVAVVNNALDEKEQAAAYKALNLQALKTQDINQALKQLREVLPESDTNAEFRMATGLWTSEEAKLDKNFTSLVRKYFDVKTGAMDDKALKSINDWAKDSSGGRVKDVVSEKEIAVPVALLNTAGIAANLAFASSEEEFTPAKGEAVKTTFLSAMGALEHNKSDNFEAVRVPIQNGRMLLYIMVPDKEAGVKAITPYLTSTNWAKLDAAFKPKNVSLSFPTLKVSSDHNLSAMLEANSIPTTLKKIADKPVLLKQKAFVELAGASVEAANSPVVEEGAEVQLKATHPFVFVVEDAATKSILLVGVYNKA